MAGSRQKAGAQSQSGRLTPPHTRASPPPPQAKTIVFVSTCKQVKFLFEALRKLRPGVPLRALHGKMNQYKRMGGESVSLHPSRVHGLVCARQAGTACAMAERSCCLVGCKAGCCSTSASCGHRRRPFPCAPPTGFAL